jgi:hypothetical protein
MIYRTLSFIGADCIYFLGPKERTPRAEQTKVFKITASKCMYQTWKIVASSIVHTH